jgi:predicted permease
MRRIKFRVMALFRRRHIDAVLDDEVRAHLDLLALDYERRGMSPPDARAAARRAFGGVDQIKEAYLDQRGGRWLVDARADLRYAVRMLIKAPAFAAVAIVTLALGIGANTAIFSILNSLYLRALPVDDPDRIVEIAGGDDRVLLEAIRGLGGSIFQSVASHEPTQFNLGAGAGAEWVDGIVASDGFLATAGVSLLAGRDLTAADDQPGGGADGPVAIISHRLWQRRFGGDPAAIGQPLRVNGIGATVVGITRPEFFGLRVGRSFDVIVPRGMLSAMDRGQRGYGLGRLRPGLSIDMASAALRSVQPRIRAAVLRDDPGRDPAQTLTDPLRVAPFGTREQARGRSQYAEPLIMLMAVVGLVLLIACVNLANLLMARAAARRQELAVRRALGATRWRLLRQMLAESLTLAVVGAAGGLLFAIWGSRFLVAQLDGDAAFLVGRIQYSAARLFLDLSVDWRVMTFAASVAVITAVVFGTAPALIASRATPAGALKDQSQNTPGERAVGYGSLLIAAQVAVSLALLVAAGLLVRTFTTLADVEFGFEPDRVLVVEIEAPKGLAVDDRLARYFSAGDKVRRIAGVDTAALSAGGVVGGVGATVRVDERTDVSGIRLVGAGWFHAVGTRVVAGREFSDRDRAGAPPVAVVNRAFARKFFRGANPVGRRVQVGGDDGTPARSLEVVGLVDDMTLSSRAAAQSQLYTSLVQELAIDGGVRDFLLEDGGLSLVIRPSSGSPLAMRQAIGSALDRLQPDLGLTFRSMRDEVDALLTTERVLAMLSGFFSLLALLLASIGLYGVTTYAVNRRQREIGIRLVLGASRREVIGAVLARALLLVAAGMAAGTIASLWLSRFVAALLFGIEPQDAATFGYALATLAVVTTLAASLPAWRASRIDPAKVLRH